MTTQDRNPSLLPWPPRGDLLNDRPLVATILCCSGFKSTGPHDRAVLFAGHVPGGAVVIDQVADPHASGPSRLASAGQFPLTPDGRPQGGGKGTRLDLGREPAGIAAVLSIPPADAPDGSIQALTAGQPFLLLVAAPGTDQVSYRVKRRHPAPDAVWTVVQLHDGWAAPALPNGTTGAQVRVRWLRDGKVISQGPTATPYAM